MSRTLFATTAVAVGSSAALLFSGIATAEPAAPPAPAPIDGLQAPGLTAVQSLSPAVQQAAADPNNAASMLMAAASAFAGNSAASADSQNLAAAVSQFVSNPGAASMLPASLPGGIPLPSGAVLPTPVPTAGGDAQHLPPAGVVPGFEAHLPPGVNPANAVGPVQPEPPVEVPTTPVSHLPDAAVEAAPAVEAAGVAPALPQLQAPSALPPGPPSPAAAAFGADAPPTQDFMYPSIGNGCLADGGNSIATAISVAGPATIPTPGPGAGQTAYVFTAVGTAGPAEVQKLPLNVTWVNLSTGKSGSATLKPRPDINATGPTTLTAIVDTGSGSIISTIFGQVTTTEKQCQFMPTIGSTVVP
ncbi:hypothetical protein MMUR_19180 [Mycolicibacterium murale]|jgi:hypothetical protein|uniref:Uncharacterized protein n=2 Tax=Mycolicibacterium murale TaxID=182220 RepID=A0A7I9WJ71_9MYCO|nr:hypothetical protein [Mycolicibacterium murale]MCV7183752.1 hypothetical protein [Mycolicibacterium murale]GFG57782.1 hypothetical protein MMUR_19180 [Mycolicibacterium murale]